MLYLLAKAKQSKEPYNSQRILLKQIKQAIASASASFGGYRQQVRGARDPGGQTAGGRAGVLLWI